MFGVQLDIWDYLALGAIFALVMAGLAVAVFVLGLLGRRIANRVNLHLALGGSFEAAPANCADQVIN
jgi:hypothetical protein